MYYSIFPADCAFSHCICCLTTAIPINSEIKKRNIYRYLLDSRTDSMIWYKIFTVSAQFVFCIWSLERNILIKFLPWSHKARSRKCQQKNHQSYSCWAKDPSPRQPQTVSQPVHIELQQIKKSEDHDFQRASIQTLPLPLCHLNIMAHDLIARPLGRPCYSSYLSKGNDKILKLIWATQRRKNHQQEQNKPKNTHTRARLRAPFPLP